MDFRTGTCLCFCLLLATLLGGRALAQGALAGEGMVTPTDTTTAAEAVVVQCERQPMHLDRRLWCRSIHQGSLCRVRLVLRTHRPTNLTPTASDGSPRGVPCPEAELSSSAGRRAAVRYRRRETGPHRGTVSSRGRGNGVGSGSGRSLAGASFRVYDGDRSVLADDAVFFVHGDDVFTSYWSSPGIFDGPH